MKPALRVVLLLTILCIAWAAPALAAEPQNVIRYQIGALLPTSDETIPMIADKAVGDVDLKVQSALAVGIAYERRFSDIFGLEFGIKYSKPKFKAEMTETPAKQPVGSVEASTRVMPLTVAALFHPLKDRAGKVDLFLGPELVYAMYGSSDLEGETIDYKNQLTWGVKVGMDVPINPKWSFTAAVEYMDLKAEVDETDVDAKFNPKPIVVVVGAAYRF